MTISLLPPSAARSERHLEAATARLGDVPVPIAPLWRPDTCPPALLPWLAWTLSVDDEWDLAGTDAARRELVASALDLHRYKGTPFAVRRALGACGVDARLVEWWHDGIDGLDVHQFAVRAHIAGPLRPGALWDRTTMAGVARAIDCYKPARSHLAWVAFVVDLESAHPGAIAGSPARRAVDRSVVPVRLGRLLDLERLDGAALDDEPVAQRRAVVDATAIRLRYGAPSRLDMVPIEGAGEGWPGLDQAVPYREGEDEPPLARPLVAAAIRTTVPVVAVHATASTVGGHQVTALPHAQGFTNRGRHVAATSVVTVRVGAFGLDAMPALDALPLDWAPLDMDMETTTDG